MYILHKDWVRFVYSDQFIVKFNPNDTAYPQLSSLKGIFLDERMLDTTIPIIKSNENTYRFNLKSTLRYKTCEDACLALRKKSNQKTLKFSRLSFYVPGKLPRTDGDIYLFAFGVIDEPNNKCTDGYINLFNEKFSSEQGACRIF